MNNFNSLDSIRHSISDKLLLVGLIVSIPSAIASGVRIFTMELRLLFVVDIIIAFVLAFAYFTRSKTNYKKRMVLLVSYVFVLGWISLNTWGIWGFGLTILFFSIIISTTLFGMRYGLFLLGLTAIFFSTFTLLVHLKLITFDWDFNALSHSTFHWFSRGIFFLAFASMAVVTLGNVHSNFEIINSNLAESESRLNLALNSVNEAVWELDVKTRKAIVSPNFFEILRYVPDAFAVNFDGWRNSIHPDDKERVLQKINEHLSGNSSSIYVEYRVKNQLGNWQWLLTRGKIVKFDAFGKPLRVLGTHSDISPRKEMEKILIESEERYRMLFMNANDAILVVTNGKVIDCNRFALTFFEMDQEKLIGKELSNLCPPIQSDGLKSDDLIKTHLNSALPLSSRKIEWEFVNSNGKILQTLMGISSIYSDEKPIYQIIIQDVTERKQFEQAKLNAIIEAEERERQKLASNLHDDIGPLMSSINMYLSLLAREQTQNKDDIILNMQGIVKDTIRGVREISSNLSPHTLNTYGLKIAIKNFVEQNRGLVEVFFNEDIGDLRLPMVYETLTYRIVKELFNNTIKHANASTIWINLYKVNEFIILYYKDDGVGFDIDLAISKNTKGMGLFNIINRLKTLKVAYNFNGKQGMGCSFEMKIKI